MKTEKLNNMTKGWFIGNFEPSLCRTTDCEVAVKQYRQGEKEEKHFHKIAEEYTVVIQGRVRMFGQIFEAGDIVVAQPGDITGFEALEDTVNVVVKLPGINNDKYIAEEEA